MAKTTAVAKGVVICIYLPCRASRRGKKVLNPSHQINEMQAPYRAGSGDNSLLFLRPRFWVATTKGGSRIDGGEDKRLLHGGHTAITTKYDS